MGWACGTLAGVIVKVNQKKREGKWWWRGVEEVCNCVFFPVLRRGGRAGYQRKKNRRRGGLAQQPFVERKEIGSERAWARKGLAKGGEGSEANDDDATAARLGKQTRTGRVEDRQSQRRKATHNHTTTRRQAREIKWGRGEPDGRRNKPDTQEDSGGEQAIPQRMI